MDRVRRAMQSWRRFRCACHQMRLRAETKSVHLEKQGTRKKPKHTWSRIARRTVARLPRRRCGYGRVQLGSTAAATPHTRERARNTCAFPQGIQQWQLVGEARL